MRYGVVLGFAVCGIVFGGFEPELRAAFFFVNKIILMYNGKRLSMVHVEYHSIDSQGYYLHKLCLNNFLKLLRPLNVIFGLFPFVELTCISYGIHIHP